MSSSNIQITNKPDGMDVSLATSTLPVTVVGPEAQVAKLTGDSVAVQVNLSNYQNQTGTVDVPATVTLIGTAADSCWVTGEYTVSVTISSATTAVTARTAKAVESEKVDDHDTFVATPQE